jgi:hypothetical protein
MASLFELSRRRKHAKDWADQFREGASPEELEYFNRFYQEPSASPILQQGALEGELDSADALRRQLMARGMNNLQAQDAVRRAKEQEEAELDRMASYIAETRGPNTIGGTGTGSYEDYRQSANTGQSQEGRYAAYKRQIPQVGTGGAAELLAEQGLPSPPQEQPSSFEDWSAQNPPTGPQPLGLDEWSRQSAMQQQMAGDVSAAADARYKSETVDDRISMLQEQAKILPEELRAKGASAELTTAYMRELNKHLSIAVAYPSDSPEHQNAVNEAEQLHRLVKGTSGSGGFNSYGASNFIKSVEDGVQKSQASGEIVGEEGGQQLMAPRQTRIVGEYQK